LVVFGLREEGTVESLQNIQKKQLADSEADPETKLRHIVVIKDSLQKRLTQIIKLDEDILEVCDTRDIENEM